MGSAFQADRPACENARSPNLVLSSGNKLMLTNDDEHNTEQLYSSSDRLRMLEERRNQRDLIEMFKVLRKGLFHA